jgi:hypothetical protein
VRLEGLGQLKKSNDLIGDRTRDLPDCSIVPQQLCYCVPHEFTVMVEKHLISLLLISSLGIILCLLVLFHCVNIPYLSGKFSAYVLNIVKIFN